MLTTDFGAYDYGNSVTVQADGKILVAGTSDYNFALARYTADGSLDTSFSGDGMLATDFFGMDDWGRSVTVQADGKILLAGGSNGDFSLARYTTDGSLDTSFSDDGTLVTDFGTDVDEGYSVTVQADGKILVAGTSGNDFALARYNTDGTLDTTFGSAVIDHRSTGNVTISGTAKQGQTLTAANTLADADGLGQISYQWLADGVTITGATGRSLTLAQAQVGKAISVQASYTDLLGSAESVTSGATAQVANVNDAPSGGLTISGSATQGQTLTAANTLADADGLGQISYQWLAGGVAIDGATGNTLTLGQAQVDKAISVKASYTDRLGTPESVTSSATAQVANVNDAPSGSVTISGSATQGQTLTAANTLADADGLGRISYQWLADGWMITGATADTLTLGQAQVGKAISVQAVYSDLLGTAESVASSATAQVANINDAPTGTVTISGTATQGQTLTATHTLADADGLGKISYQWLADGVTITGATGRTLTLTQAQVDKAISVQAVYSDLLGTAESVSSSATANVVNVNDLGTLAISGTMTQTRVLTATVTDADGVPGAGVRYQWLADGVAITGATAKSYTLTQADIGHAISAVASYQDSQGTQESLTKATTALVGRFFQGGAGRDMFDGSVGNDICLAGEGRDRLFGGLGSDSLHGGVDKLKDIFDFNSIAESTVGSARDQIHNFVTTVDKIDLSDIDADTVQAGDQEFAFSGTSAKANSVWYQVADVDGSSATQDIIVCGDVNGDAKADFEIGLVGVTSVAAADFVTSRAMALLPNLNDLGAVAISGTATQKQVLTATVTDVDGLPGKIGYQWLADGVAIAGATGRSLTLAQAQVGKAISVQASYIDVQGTAESVTSSATAQVANVNDPGTLAISGTATQKQVLTATVTDADGVPGAGVTYQWLADGVAITGATAKSYTLTQADVGHAISAVVSYQDSQGTQESLTKTMMAPVGGFFQGGAGQDIFNGSAGNDVILAGAGQDRLFGGLGSDSLHGGVDKVKDLFDFNAIAESTIGGARDKVHNFVTAIDQIDLAGIDADTVQAGDQAFAFSGSSAKANSLWYQMADVDGSSATQDIIVYGDVNGDAKADFEIGLVGVTVIVAADFVL